MATSPLADFDEEAERSDRRSPVDKILEQLPKDKREALLEALHAPDKYGASVVVKVLRQWGYPIPNYNVRNWRAGRNIAK